MRRIHFSDSPGIAVGRKDVGDLHPDRRDSWAGGIESFQAYNSAAEIPGIVEHQAGGLVEAGFVELGDDDADSGRD